jgi:hypothetical protein
VTEWGITGWVLEAFADDWLAAKHALHGVDTDEVREVTGAPSSDPMYEGGWPLPPERLGWAERATGLELDPTFDYFLIAALSPAYRGGEDSAGGSSGVPELASPTVPELVELRLLAVDGDLPVIRVPVITPQMIRRALDED